MKCIGQFLVIVLIALGANIVPAMSDEGPHAPAQTLCPVMEDNPIDQSIHVDYRGERVYFCCLFCKAAFEKEPGKYLPKLPPFLDGTEMHAEESAHDHAVDHEASGRRSRLLTFLGRFHPVAIHIPIALVLVAALAELLAMITRSDTLHKVSRFNIDVAVLGAAASVALGLFAGMSADYPGEFARPFWLHKWLGITTGIFIAVAAVLSELAYRRHTPVYRWSYRAILLLCVGLVGATGFFGGQLVYGLNHYVW